jgi:replicative DNA helicase
MSSETIEAQLPPQNLDAEKALLGAMVLDAGVIDQVQVRQEQFYSDQNAKIFLAMQEMSRAGIPIDAVTLTEDLIRRGIYEDIGGFPAVAELLEVVPHTAHAQHYAGIVKEKSLLREAIYSARSIVEECFRPDADAESVLANAVKRLSSLDVGGDGKLVSLVDSCTAVLASIQEQNGQGLIDGRLMTGFKDLDNYLGGLRGGQLIVVASRPGGGKTAWAMNTATNVMKAGNAVLFVSLEMSHRELTERLLSSETGINTLNIARGQISEYEMEQLYASAAELASQRMFYLDSEFSLSAITAEARRAYRKNGVRFVIADYLQLIDAEMKRGMLREQAVSAVSRELKRLAMELSIPVLVLSQLNREVEKRNDKRPQLSDLRESGAIEQDANVVMFLHRPDMYDAEDRPGQADLIIAKNRTGPTGLIPLMWRKEFCRFEDMPEVILDFMFPSDVRAAT